jgi:hypothetical protein
MSALPDKLFVNQARQGGFTSVQLPGPLALGIGNVWVYRPSEIDKIQSPTVMLTATPVITNKGPTDAEVGVVSGAGPAGGPALRQLEVIDESTREGIAPGGTTRPISEAGATFNITNSNPDARMTPGRGFTLEMRVKLQHAPRPDDNRTDNMSCSTSLRAQAESGAPGDFKAVLSISQSRFSSGVDTTEIRISLNLLGTTDFLALKQSVDQSYHHYAVSFDFFTQKALVYIDGQRLGSAGFTKVIGPGDAADELDIDPATFTGISFYTPASLNFGGTDFGGPLSGTRTGFVHDARFTHTAKYLAPFTPPPLT